MFSHIFLGVSDFERALPFYTELMAALGKELKFCDRSRPWAGWQTPGQARPLFLLGSPYALPHHPGNGQMVAFQVQSRDRVRQLYQLALLLGGRGEGEPGLRTEYHPDYYGAYFRDLDGNKLCVVCHEAESG